MMFGISRPTIGLISYVRQLLWTRGRFDSRKLTLTASLAGVYALFRFLPLSIFIGGRGTLTAGGMFIPVLAVLLGPAYGVLAIFIGSLVGFLSPNNPVRFGGIDFLPGTLNFLLVSLVIRGRRTSSALLMIGVILSFVAIPHTVVFVGRDLGSPPIPYFWLHLVALFLLLSPLTRNLGTKLSTESYSNIGYALALAALTGTMIEHLTGGVLFAVFFPSIADVSWRFIYLAYPVERAAIVAGAVLVCSPVLRNLRIIKQSMIFEKARSMLPSRRVEQ